MGWRRGRKAKKRTSFNPNREYVQDAVNEFLKDGGTITKIEMDEKAYQAFIKLRDAAADDFLNGRV